MSNLVFHYFCLTLLGEKNQCSDEIYSVIHTALIDGTFPVIHQSAQKQIIYMKSGETQYCKNTVPICGTFVTNCKELHQQFCVLTCRWSLFVLQIVFGLQFMKRLLQWIAILCFLVTRAGSSVFGDIFNIAFSSMGRGL